VQRLVERVAELERHFALSGKALEKVSASAGAIGSRGQRLTSLDLDVLEAGIRENGAFLESLNPPTCDINDPAFSQFVVDLLGEGADVFLFLQTFGPTFIQNIVVPDGLGLQFFTVLATPSQRIGDVIADIQALVTAGDLTAGQARALIQVLTNALRSLGNDETQAACSQLSAFGAVATAKVTAGQLDDAAAQSLIAEVQSIREQLGCDGAASPSGAFLDTCEVCS
jgi:hypothetical protein